MSRSTAFHLSAGVCFVIALVLYVLGWTAPDGGTPMYILLIGGFFFELLAWGKLIRGAPKGSL